MPTWIAKEAMNNPNEFIWEIIEAHGEDSIQHAWAVTMVKQIQTEVLAAQKKNNNN